VVVVRLFSANERSVFARRTLAIAAEHEDVGDGTHRPCDPLLWHLVRSSDAEPTGVFDTDNIGLLGPYVRREKDEELVMELVKMHGS
jgi:hypothetical protein